MSRSEGCNKSIVEEALASRSAQAIAPAGEEEPSTSELPLEFPEFMPSGDILDDIYKEIQSFLDQTFFE